MGQVRASANNDMAVPATFVSGSALIWLAGRLPWRRRQHGHFARTPVAPATLHGVVPCAFGFSYGPEGPQALACLQYGLHNHHVLQVPSIWMAKADEAPRFERGQQPTSRRHI